MSYVIYNKETTLILSAKRGKDYFATERAAKGARTKILNAHPEYGTSDDFDIAEARDFYDNIEKKEIRHGIVHCQGKTYEVGVNTPWTSGPWSETYWCQ